jgi:hypothetical protein
MSYANVVMYSAVLPSYHKSEKGKGGKGERINADDPENREKVMREMFG